MTRIGPLLRRGQEAYVAQLQRMHSVDEMPLGAPSLHIVTRSDFVAYAALCLDFVSPCRSLHILDPDGNMHALLSSHRAGHQ